MRISRFLGEMTAYDGEGDINTASVCFNGRIEDTRFRPRYGYRSIATPVAGFEACHLFEFVSGYKLDATTSTYQNITEVFSIEKVSGVVKPYSYDPVTGVRTEILSGSTSLSLPDMEHVCAVFGEYVYVVCPGLTGTGTRVWRHKITDNTSYEVVQNTAYVAPPIDASINIPPTTTAYDPYEFVSGDTVTATGSIGGINWSTVNGTIVVKGSTLTGVNALNHSVEVVFAATQNWSNRAYIGLEILGGSNSNWFTLAQQLELRIGGVWTAVETYPQIDSTGRNILIAGYIKGLTLTAVQGIRARFLAGSFDDNQPTTATAYTVAKLKLGGNLLEASAPTSRAWTADPGDGIQYAARYKHSSGTPVPTAIAQTPLSPEGAKGVANASYSNLVLGGRPVLTVLAANTGTYDQVQFLRRLQDGVTWKEIAVVANTGTTVTFADFYEENEMAARPTVVISGSGTTTTTPPFSGDGITAVFATFGRMAWGRGTSIDYSYAGDPLSLYSASAPTPDPRDGRQAVQWTLADNFADEVVAGAVAGRVGTIIFGRKATYAQTGTIPVTMSPPGEIQGSRGIAGRKAFDAYLTPDGNEGVVSVDPTGGVWFVPYSSITTNNGQGDARVVELSRGNPNTIWEWLVEGQTAEFGYTSLELVKVVYCKDTAELRISLGNRAVVLDTINGDTSPQWTRHQFSLTTPPGSVSSSSCTGFENLGATASSVAPGDAAWTNTGYAFSSDDSYTSASLGFGTSQATETLRVVSVSPDNALPVGATIDSQTLRVKVGMSGDLQVTATTIQPKKGGVALGANLATGQVLQTSDQIMDFALASLASTAEINSGQMQVDLKFTQETWLATWNDPANWTIVISPTSPSDYPYATSPSASHTTGFTVTYTWIGGGVAPTQVWATYTGATSLSCVAPATGTGSTTNGLGDSAAGDVYNNIGIPPDPGSSASLGTSSTVTERLTLTAGVATKSITMVSTATVPAAKMRATHTLSAGIYTPTPATVRVDNVAYKTCSTIAAVSPGVTSGVAWSGVSWLDPNKLWAIRSTGHIDELRFNTVTKQWIGGDGRDGGYAMPSPYWESQLLKPAQASHLAWVYLEKVTPNETVTVKAKTDRDGYITAQALRDSYKFSVTQQGKSHKLRFEIDETSAGLRSAMLDFKPLSTQYTK